MDPSAVHDHLGGLPCRSRCARLPGVPPRRLHDEFDAWADDYAIPYDDLRAPTATATGTPTGGSQELEADGVVAEVHVPQHRCRRSSPKPSLSASRRPPTADDVEQRWAGLQAHNRWLADFCARRPGRRAGIAQILLHDVDAAVDEIRWARGGRAHRRHRCCPARRPGCGLPQLLRPALRADLGGVRGARRAGQPPRRERRVRRCGDTDERQRRCSSSRSRGGRTARSGT